MNDPTAPLTNWQNFYVVVGSAAGSLTGLQFVVMTLIAQSRAAASMTEIRAFGTPTVVQFCTALLISALTAAPWRSLEAFGVCVGLGGALGVIYSLRTFRHARNAAYTPDLEDWIWYTGLPLAAHLALVTAAVLILWNANLSLIVVAADAIAFLFIGIHNAWDTVTYIAVNHTRNSSGAQKPPET
jgi:hypothetical protein